MKGLTEKQRSILDFIENFQERENMAPTVYEIAEYFKIKTSTVFAHIRALHRKNYLSRSSKARSIALTKPRRRPKMESFVIAIPLLGRINAGMPIESLELREGEIFCDPSFLGSEDSKRLFALRIQGESMRDLGILDGDIVIVKQADSYRPGSIVVALVGSETTVKSYYPMNDGKIELRPANTSFQPQIYPASEVHLQGSVIALTRKFRP